MRTVTLTLTLRQAKALYKVVEALEGEMPPGWHLPELADQASAKLIEAIAYSQSKPDPDPATPEVEVGRDGEHNA